MANKNQNANQSLETVGERHALALPIALEEGPPPAIARATMAIISALVVTLLAWSSIATVREVSMAAGEITPFGATRQAAHLEGGIVEQVLVTPGDKVRAGQALVQLQRETAGGEFDRYDARRANLEILSERLAAQIDDRDPNFAPFRKTWQRLVIEQQSVFNATRTEHRAAMDAMAEREASAASEVEKSRAVLTSEKALLKFAQEQLAIQDALIKDGFTAKQTHLQAQAAVASATAAVASANAQLDQARRALALANNEKQKTAAEHENAIATERAAVAAELAELRNPIASLRDRTERLTVRAPVSGVVNDILVNGRGDVVRPGGVVAEITPVGAELIAKVRVQPQDIGHVKLGLETEIAITTFDPNRYGKLRGRISFVSADAFTDERTGEVYYVAHIALDAQTIGDNSNERALSAGMQVQAGIITQNRSLMRYILKPVARSLDQAFTER